MSLADKVTKHLAAHGGEIPFPLDDIDVAEARALCRLDEAAADPDFTQALYVLKPVPVGVVGYFHGVALLRPDSVPADAIEEKREASAKAASSFVARATPVVPKPKKDGAA